MRHSIPKKKKRLALFEALESRRLLAVDVLAQVELEPDSQFLPRAIAPFNGSVVVRGSDGRGGPEPWITDGSPESTRLLKDIFVGPRGSGPSEFTEYQGRLFFSANNGFSGYELWVTAGTKGSTQLLTDIWAGAESGAPDNIVVFHDLLYFFANDGVTGRELYRSDGTALGTQLVADSIPGRGGSSGEELIVVGDHMFFVGDSNPSEQSTLWVSDGTATGTRPLTPDGQPPSSVGLLTPFGGQLVFVLGNRLFVTDGSIERTVPLEPMGDALGSEIHSMAAAQGKLFVASDAGLQVLDAKLNSVDTLDAAALDVVSSDNKIYYWRSDGFFVLDSVDATTQLLGFNSLFGTKMGTTFQVPGGMLFHINRALDRHEIWVTDGTLGGTKLIETVTDESTEPLAGFQQIGDSIYFSATNGKLQESLWKVPAPIIEGPREIDGDITGDLVVDAADIDALFVALASASFDSKHDLDQDGQVTHGDADYLIEALLRTRTGDTDLNGRDDFDDFVVLSASFGAVDVGWQSGDFTGDGVVDFEDFVLLSTHFGFVSK